MNKDILIDQDELFLNWYNGITDELCGAQGETSDPVFREVVRRSKHLQKVVGYEKKLRVIQERIHVVEGVREVEVLHWILEGKGYSWIARQMSLSERHIRRLKDSIVIKMSEMLRMPNTSRNCS